MYQYRASGNETLPFVWSSLIRHFKLYVELFVSIAVIPLLGIRKTAMFTPRRAITSWRKGISGMLLDSSSNVMAHGDAWEGKWKGNWRMKWVAGTLHTSSDMVYPALLPLMCTPRLPVVDWTDAPADLNGVIRFAERRNLVSVRVPSHFKRSINCERVCRKGHCSFALRAFPGNITSLISNFRRVLNVVCLLLGNSPASELPRRKNTTLHPLWKEYHFRIFRYTFRLDSGNTWLWSAHTSAVPYKSWRLTYAFRKNHFIVPFVFAQYCLALRDIG